QKNNFDKIFETRTEYFRRRTIRATTQQRACATAQFAAAGQLQAVTVGAAHGEVEPAVGSERESVQAAVVLMTEAGEQHRALVRNTVAVRVFEGHKVRRVGNVKASLAPGEPHRKHQ